MARKYLVPIDLNKNELQNATIQNLATPPASPAEGQVYYDTDTNIVYFWNGTSWISTQTDPYTYGSGESTTVSITGAAADGDSTALARADHEHAGPGFGAPTAVTSYGQSAVTGTASTVAHSDHTHGTPAHTDTEHSGIHLNALAAPTGDVSLNSHKLTSVTDPTSAQDAATKNYVDTRKVTDLAAPISAFSMNSQKITGLATPTTDYDAANKLYVDQAVQGLTWKDSVNLLAGPTTNIALTGTSGTLVIDGHAALDDTDDGYRILLIGQADTSQRGIYTYADNGTTYTLTRSIDADTHDELIGATVFIKEGTSYGATSWVQSNHYITSFAGQTWVQFSGAGTYTASNGVVLDVKDFQFAPKSDGGLATGASGGYVKLQTNSGLGTTSDGLAVGAGTGITVSTGTVAIDTAVVARKYSQTLTGALSNLVTITHNLGTKDVLVQVYTVADDTQVEVDVTRTSTLSITLGFSTAPSSGAYRVVVIG